VCAVCLDKCVKHYDRLANLINSKKCIFDENFPSRHDIIDLTIDESAVECNVIELNSSQIPQQYQINNITNNVFDVIQPLIDKQLHLCKDYLNNKEEELNKTVYSIDNMYKEMDNMLSEINKSLYKFDYLRKFKYDDEIIITDNNDILVTSHSELSKPKDLPQVGMLVRKLLKLGDKAYALKYSLSQPWFEVTIMEHVLETSFNDNYYNVSFCDDGEVKYLSTKCLAYEYINDKQYTVGSRVIAKFNNSSENMTDKLYVGIIAELPIYLNNFRCV